MFQNIKVDIIYHKSNTDFEMEFNLCGCCRMRLLTAKSPDKKTLVHSLSRAVSRSRVIIIVGELFGEDNIVDTIAAATSSKTEIADNKKYGIDSNIDIKIIDKSIPLVTAEGYFGGCIIEKGPQTMILLTDNKNVRKSVMRSLIHPYIEELCALDLKEKAPFVIENQVSNENNVVSDDVENVEIEDENTEIGEEEPFYEQDVSSDGIVLDENEYVGLESESERKKYEDEEMELVTSDDYDEIEMERAEDSDWINNSEYEVESDLICEEETFDLSKIDFINSSYEEAYEEESNLEGLLTEEDEAYYRKGEAKKSSNVLLWVVATIVLALFLIVCYSVFVVPASDGVSPVDYVKEIYNTLFS